MSGNLKQHLLGATHFESASHLTQHIMCRSIKKLRNEDPATPAEIEAAALQFVRKVSGYRKPSKNNTPVFDQAVQDIAAATQILLGNLVTNQRSKTS